MSASNTWAWCSVLLVTAAVLPAGADTLGTAVTYQGQLVKDGLPVIDTCDFEFECYDAAAGGSQVGPTVTSNGVPVDNGLFTVALDFGGGVFAGDARWLEVAVQCSGDGGFTTLVPRQEITPAPYALYALNAVGDGHSLDAADGDPVDALFVDNDGDVGIGTTSPIGPFEIHSSTFALTFFSFAGTGGASAAFVSNAADLFNLGVNGSGAADPGTASLSIFPGDMKFQTGSAERIRILANGNVGIGTASPTNKLSVAGNADFTGNVGIGTAAPTHKLTVENPLADDVLRLIGPGQPFGEGARLNFGDGDFAYIEEDQDDRLTIYANERTALMGGNVGIGTASPTNRLSVAGQADFSSKVGIGTAFPSNLLTVAGIADFVGDVGIGTAAPANRLTVAGNANITGNVGIGTASPTRGKLDIEGSENFNIASYGWLNSAGNTGSAGGTNPYSLYASDRVAASEFNAHSDARIKRSLGRSDSAEDLSTLMKIEVTDYTLIDTVAHGTQRHKKAIGQQIDEVFPQAVTKTTDVVPNIYQMADVEDGWIILQTDLGVGDRVKLITDRSSGIHDVLEVGDGRFRVDLPGAKQVFVYGREVDDFHNVDYEEIAMLNVSATQQLYKLLHQLKDENEALRSEVEELRAGEAAMASLQQRVAAIESSLKTNPEFVALGSSRAECGGAR